MVRKIFLQSAIVAGVMLLFLSACEKDQGPVIIMPPTPVDTFVHFESQVQPIFNANCIICHNQYHPFLDLRDGYSWNQLLTTGFHAPYVDISNPDNSLLIKHLRGQLYLMPPNAPPLKSPPINLIAKWMKEGARNN